MEDLTVPEPSLKSDLAGLAAKTAGATEHPSIWGKTLNRPDPVDNVELLRNLHENGQYPTIAKVVTMASVQARERDAGLEAGLPALTLDDVYIVWFAYVLGGWKALASTTRGDSRYYEVTYDKEKHSVYIDTYLKINNHPIAL